ncbi:MAG: hypothetical protein K8T25_10495 [Planctomycetia bacterium]|nr:hypothetical protein [Planctomycetia bacterium]
MDCQPSSKPGNVEDQRPWNFSLRSLFVLVTVVAGAFAVGYQLTVLIAAIAITVYCLIKKYRSTTATLVVGFIWLTLIGFGTTTEFRLDTGDMRETFWGCPISYSTTMKPAARAALLSLQDPQVPSRWVWCVTERGTDHPFVRVRYYYQCAGEMAVVDPGAARLVVRDIAECLQKYHGSGRPECAQFLWLPRLINPTPPTPRLIHGWQNDPAVKAYLAGRGYPPSSAATP